MDRSQFILELNDPEVAKRFYALMQSEVGGQGPEAQTAWAETVFNRAAANGTSVYDIISNRRYYEPYQNGSFNRNYRNLNDRTIAKLNGPLQTALQGSDITGGATHNGSGSVARSVYRGGYDADPSSVRTIGGETYYRKTFPKERQWYATVASAPAPVEQYSPGLMQSSRMGLGANDLTRSLPPPPPARNDFNPPPPTPNPAYSPGKDYTQPDFELPPVEIEQYVNRGPRGDYGPPMMRGATVMNPTPASTPPQMPSQPNMPLPGASPFRNAPKPVAPIQSVGKPYANAVLPRREFTPGEMVQLQLGNNLFKFW